MNAIEKFERVKRRLLELEMETEDVVNQYIQQVAMDPYSSRLKELKQKHQSLRKEQTELYDHFNETRRKAGELLTQQDKSRKIAGGGSWFRAA